MNYDCIIFDLYNTLIDDSRGTEERERFRLDNIYTILEKAQYPVKFDHLAEKYGQMIKDTYDREESMRSLHPIYQVRLLLDSLSVHDIVVFKKVYDIFSESIIQINPQPMKHAEKALKHLKEKEKKIGLISNTGKTPGHALRMMLIEIGLFDYFDDMVFSEEIGFMKPDPAIFELAVRRLDADRAETIYIGDIKAIDYDGAKSAGLNAHLFNKVEDDLYQLALDYSGGY